MPISSAGLSFVPNVSIANSLTNGGAASMSRSPTSSTGDRQVRLSPASSSATPRATPAVTSPARMENVADGGRRRRPVLVSGCRRSSGATTSDGHAAGFGTAGRPDGCPSADSGAAGAARPARWRRATPRAGAGGRRAGAASARSSCPPRRRRSRAGRRTSRGPPSACCRGTSATSPIAARTALLAARRRRRVVGPLGQRHRGEHRAVPRAEVLRRHLAADDVLDVAVDVGRREVPPAPCRPGTPAAR